MKKRNSIHQNKILKQFVSQIEQKFGNNLKQVILFGSHARGDYSAESDYDLLIIFKDMSKEIETFIEDKASEILIEKGLLFSTFIFRIKEFEKMKFEPFIMNAMKDGVYL